jgi:hypothetical protein
MPNLDATKLSNSGISSSTALSIRSSKTVGIAFFTSMLISVFAMEVAESRQICPNMQPSIKIINESGGRMSGTSLETLGNSLFKDYVTTISKHISTKIRKTVLCREDVNKTPKVELFFVYRSVFAYAQSQIGPPFNLELTQANGSRSLDSPWVKIVSSPMPKPIVRAAFIWNERQILFDQVQMSGARASPSKQLVPIDSTVFEKFVQDYTNSVLLSTSSESESAAQRDISRRLPIEILWLFRHAPQTTFMPFTSVVDNALNSIVKQTAVGYTDLATVITDQFFASTETYIHYESVVELKNIPVIDKYHVN